MLIAIKRPHHTSVVPPRLAEMCRLVCRCFPPGTRAKNALLACGQFQIERTPFFWRLFAPSTEPIATAVSAKGAGGSILCPQSVRVSKTDLNRVRQGFFIQGWRWRWKRRCILHSRKGHFVERSIVA